MQNFPNFIWYYFRQPKMNVDGIYYVHQSYCCQKFWNSHFNVMFSMSILSQFSFTRILYYNRIKFAYAFPYYGYTIVQFMTCMESYCSLVFLWLACSHRLLWYFLWLQCFHRSPYMTFYDFPVFCMVVNPGSIFRMSTFHNFDWS